MTPVEIIIASCLAAAPTLLGTIVSFVIAAHYVSFRITRSDKGNWWYIPWDEEQIKRRSMVIFWFWLLVFSLAGGFASGVYVQSTLDLLQYLT